MTSGPSYTRTDRALELALYANFFVHAWAIVGMALFLAPMLPGGTLASDADRVALIANHALRFRLGWLPWHLCAVVDLALALAMVRTRWMPRGGRWLVLVLTVCAVIPDQYAQVVWITRGVALARTDVAQYLALEKELFPLTAGWGALLYTLGALGWTWCFARAGTWSRALSWLSAPLFAAMTLAVVSPILPPSLRPSSVVIASANAVGFVILQVWLGLVTEEVLRRARPFEPHGRWARWRHPSRWPHARLAEWLANSRFFGVLLEPLPELTMRSDITDVVYVNYLVDADALAPLVPPGLELQRLGPSGAHALFSFLTYRHGHFGFAFLGPLRRLMPSPIQTNWRVHVVDPRTGHRGITFVTNAIDHTMMALAARLTTEGMPMHSLSRAQVKREPDGAMHVLLDPGTGSAPDAELRLRPADGAPPLEGAWAECFDDFNAFLAYCVPQDRAMSSQPLRSRISRQEIDLGVPIEACEPLVGTVTSRAARALVGDATPICFRVAAVRFEFSQELHDYGQPGVHTAGP